MDLVHILKIFTYSRPDRARVRARARVRLFPAFNKILAKVARGHGHARGHDRSGGNRE
jgi:hypothetical protein